jgi:predicted nucleotidyltransferase component of viral defense system
VREAFFANEEQPMNAMIGQMLEKYPLESRGDYENALREIFQELALLGLWRGKFFEHAAFYGGTALRILYGMYRYSEDLDFSLLKPVDGFDFSPFCRCIENELQSWGFPVSVELKKKTAETAIESAFLKAGTLQQMITVNAPSEITGSAHRNQILRIKVEIDTEPPGGFETETRFLTAPIPFSVRVYKEEFLFAGKMHALLFRNWKNRIKGRDWYDWVWYAARGTKLNLAHLEVRMRESGSWSGGAALTDDRLRMLLRDKIESLDVEHAKNDVVHFLRDKDSIAVWSKAFFTQMAEQLQTV